MHDDPKPAGDLSPAREDERVQTAVLALVLAEYPAQLTVLDLLREMDGGPADFVGEDAVERAIGDLVGVGLLHRNGAILVASRAALRFDQLGI